MPFEVADGRSTAGRTDGPSPVGMAPPETSGVLPVAPPPTGAAPTLYWVTSRDTVDDARARVLAREQETDPAAQWEPAAGRRLRLAVAMRGGVSLAVWIGGAVAELDLLRGIEVCRLGDRAYAFVAWPAPAPPSGPVRDRVRRYAELLHASGFSGVDCDVLAGASAGGLNSVMWATAQRAGAPVDSMLATWRDVGGLAALMHPPGFRGVDSLLQGDAYFWPQVRYALERFHWSANAHPDRAAPHVSVDLSATLIDSADAADPDIREGRGDFHFSGRASTADPLWPERVGALPNDIPTRALAPTLGDDGAAPGDRAPRGSQVATHDALGTIARLVALQRATGSLDDDARAALSLALAALPDARVGDADLERDVHEASTLVLDGDVARSLDRLAYAARTTSSFPGAFEPARIDSTAGGTALPTGDRPHMRFAFGAHREPGQPPYLVIDGGVFDNIPITRALAVVRMRTANVHVERRLVYLDPSPPTDPLLRTPYDPRGSRFTRAVLAAVARRLRKETEAGEVADIDAFARQVQLGFGRSESFAALARVSWTAAERDRRERAYVRYRQSSDANLLVEVLTTPSRHQLTWRVPVRRAWVGIDRPTAEAVRQAVYYRAHNAAWGDAAILRTMTRDPQGLVDAAQCVLSCVRWIEQIRLWSQSPDLDAIVALLRGIRQDAYHVMNTAVALRDAALVRVLEAAEAARRGDAAGDLDIRVADAAKDAWFAPPMDAEAAALARAWEVLDTQVRALVEPLRRLRDLAATVTADEHAAAIRQWSDPPPDTAQPGWERGTVKVVWDEGPWVALLDAQSRMKDRLVADILPPLFSATGMPPILDDLPYARIDSHIEPDEVRPDADGRPSVLAPTVTRLLAVDRRERVQAALDAAGKGADVAAALLSDRGRLTANVKLAGTKVANFSGFLSAQWRENDWWWGRLDMADGIVRMLIPGGDRDASELLRAAILRDVEAAGGAGATEPPLVRGVDGIGALDPAYTTAIASRGLRVVSRALPRPGVRAGALAVTALLWLARPILVVLPAAVDIPRLVAVAVVLLAAGVATGWDRYADAPGVLADWVLQPWFFVPALVALGALLFAFSEASARWRTVADAAPGDRDIARWRGGAGRRGWLFAVAVVVALVPLALAVGVGDAVMGVVWIVVLSVLVVLVDAQARRVPPASARSNPLTGAVGGAGVLLVLVLAGAFAAVLGVGWLRIPDAAWWLPIAVWATALALVGMLLLAGWQRPLAVVAMAVGAVVVGLAAAAAVWALTGLLALSWVVGIVAWGNVLWLAPETGWGARPLSDAPRPPR